MRMLGFREIDKRYLKRRFLARFGFEDIAHKEKRELFSSRFSLNVLAPQVGLEPTTLRLTAEGFCVSSLFFPVY